ncbi:MAG TPA: four helix bundle protein [Gemmatimonadaceae bacterium]|nr:four helix bundle protein [Gemmatimonadaceae bacterium]
MNEIAENLKERSIRFALRLARFCRTLPDTWDGRFVRDQLFRSGARIAANYRAACRARSHRDFVSKLGMTVEESDESVFWLMFVARAGMVNNSEQKELLDEAGQLLAIFMASSKTASTRRPRPN